MEEVEIEKIERPPPRKKFIFSKIIVVILLVTLLCMLCVKHMTTKTSLDDLEEAIGCRNRHHDKFLQHLEDNYLHHSVNNINEGFGEMKSILHSSYKSLGINKSIPSNQLKLVQDFKGFKGFETHMRDENVPEKVWKFIFEKIKHSQPSYWGRCLH